MKYALYSHGERTGVAVVAGDGRVIPTGHQTMTELIAHGGEPRIPEEQPLAGARLLAPLTRPGKILCAGINYRSHKDENPEAVLPQEPSFFSKLPSAVIGDGDAIVLPGEENQVDYEVELAAVIGQRARGLSREEALGCVFGYTVINDVSARDIQFDGNQLTLGKGIDTFCPLGPVIVPASEIPDPQDLMVASYVNGERRQYESTGNMLFTVARLLEFITAYITLEPGDVVTTGTPAGVGTFRHPPLYLRPGDVVEVEVEGIGRLRNPVAKGW